MSIKPRGADALHEWRKPRKVTVTELSKAIGDPGGQLAKWASGSREKLPIRLIVALSRHTGIPLEDLAEPDQLQVAREIFAVMARDAAA